MVDFVRMKMPKYRVLESLYYYFSIGGETTFLVLFPPRPSAVWTVDKRGCRMWGCWRVGARVAECSSVQDDTALQHKAGLPAPAEAGIKFNCVQTLVHRPALYCD